jgi:hypothetical protein
MGDANFKAALSRDRFYESPFRPYNFRSNFFPKILEKNSFKKQQTYVIFLPLATNVGFYGVITPNLRGHNYMFKIGLIRFLSVNYGRN